METLFKLLESDFNGTRELSFFLVKNPCDAIGVLLEFGVCVLHLGAYSLGHGRKKWRWSAQFVRVTQSATNDFPQHIAATFVGRDHTIRN